MGIRIPAAFFHVAVRHSLLQAEFIMIRFRSPLFVLLPLVLTGCAATDRQAMLPPARPVVDSTVAHMPIAASTGGNAVEVAWGYRFKAGDRMRIRRQTTSSNRTGSPLFFTGDDEVLAEVESVDADGVMTLTMTTLKNVMREKTGPQHPLVKSSYANRTPKLRVRMDRFGKVLSGEIVIEDEEHHRMKLAASQPGSRTHVVDDIKIIRLEANDFLPILTAPATVRVGETYRDTVKEVSRWRSISLDTTKHVLPVPGKVQGSSFGDETGRDSNVVTTANSITPIGRVDHGSERYLRAELAFERILPTAGGTVFLYRHRTEYLIRSDGAIVRAEMVGSNDRDGVFEGTSSEVMELLEE
jgi:hypothetical protein